MNDKAYAKLALSLMDLTSLETNDTDEKIQQLCQSAVTDAGHTAAVCVYPAFIATAANALKQHEASVKIATVTNFPHGNDDVVTAVKETEQAIADGADEVDVVFPYRALMADDEQVGADLVKQCKSACGDKMLKVIIESGELKTPALIKRASEIAIENGADFIKTSTGKVAVNATPEAAEVMLQAIADSGKPVGFKAAGGVRSVEDAKVYLQLAEKIMGSAWVSPATFRFGASGLLASLLATLNDQAVDNTTAY